jgi:hypothetical protein
MTIISKLFIAVGVVFWLDIAIFTAVISYLNEVEVGWHHCCWDLVHKSGTVDSLGIVSLPVGFYALRTYRFARPEMNPLARFLARLPLCCLVGLLLGWFVAFPLVCRFR